MPRFRYRTATLVGPWRDTMLEAETDAVAVGQAEFQGRGQHFVWKVKGQIEVESGPLADTFDGPESGTDD